MKGSRHQSKHEIDSSSDAVPFTARLTAYYRFKESERVNPLLLDPYAKLLAGDMSSYFESHLERTGDYPVIRSYYIENTLLRLWCESHTISQIVLIGSGLDTRAYRFEPLRKYKHIIFELDFPVINRYKEQVLHDKTPLCKLERISSNISHSEWPRQLLDRGFSKETPTFWILEGIAYYLDRKEVVTLLQILHELSSSNSQIFADFCVPGLADAKFGPFMMHFKWGMEKDDAPSFFASNGWSVIVSYADDHDHGRDVGQRGLFFISGNRRSELNLQDDEQQYKISGLDRKGLSAFALDLTKRIIPQIEMIVSAFYENPHDGVATYIEFLRGVKPSLQIITTSFKHPLSIGRISPRLLRDPSSMNISDETWSEEERESHIAGYLKSILFLLYCAILEIDGDQFADSPIFKEVQKNPDIKKMQTIRNIIQLLKEEIKQLS